MTDTHKKRIANCYEAFIDNMSVDGIIVRLISACILTVGEVDEIAKHRVRAKQIQTLLTTLLHKPDHAFDILVGALWSTEQGHLANLLLKEGKSSVYYIKRYLVCCTVIC